MVGLWLVVGLVLGTTQGVLGGLTRVCRSGDVPIQGNCGSNLPGMIQLVCGLKGYNGHSNGKRGGIFTHPTSGTGVFQRHDNKPPVLDGIVNKRGESIFVPRHAAVSILRADKRWTSSNSFQGIVCECCHNRCDMSEMLEYCGDDSLTKRAAPGPPLTDSYRQHHDKTAERDPPSTAEQQQQQQQQQQQHRRLYDGAKAAKWAKLERMTLQGLRNNTRAEAAISHSAETETPGTYAHKVMANPPGNKNTSVQWKRLAAGRAGGEPRKVYRIHTKDER